MPPLARKSIDKISLLPGIPTINPAIQDWELQCSDLNRLEEMPALDATLHDADELRTRLPRKWDTMLCIHN